MKRRIERLPREVRELLAPFFPGFDLSRIRIYEGIPRYVVGHPVGYADRNKVYLAAGAFDVKSIEGMSLLAHEITHCRQYLQHGKWQFRARYLRAYFKNRHRGMTHGEAYWNIPFEIEAREIERRIYQALSNLETRKETNRINRIFQA
jgi:hypothetical protein